MKAPIEPGDLNFVTKSEQQQMLWGVSRMVVAALSWEYNFAQMNRGQQKRGVLVSFPCNEDKEDVRPPLPNNCSECARLELAYQTAINDIYAAIRSAGTVGQRLARMFEKQDERDRAISAFYSHKKTAHPHSP